jgi:pyruvate dehydrogenase E2 component (dihydrolipoamide acetyltransferase)
MTADGVRDFLVPDLGEGLEDATITSWLVAVGDQVELNQTLCTVETNKAEVEIPSPHAGRIVELGGAEGDTLPVGSMLVRFATTVAAAREPVLVGYGADDAMDATRRPAGRPRAKPPVRKLAADLKVDMATIAPGSGPDGVVTRDGHGARRWRTDRNGPTDGLVAQGDTRCSRLGPGGLLSPAAVAGPAE